MRGNQIIPVFIAGCIGFVFGFTIGAFWLLTIVTGLEKILNLQMAAGWMLAGPVIVVSGLLAGGLGAFVFGGIETGWFDSHRWPLHRIVVMLLLLLSAVAGQYLLEESLAYQYYRPFSKDPSRHMDLKTGTFSVPQSEQPGQRKNNF
jgi:hypothetical protein